MIALQRAYSQRRLVEMRISGGFPHAPYQPTRSADDHAGIDESLRANAGVLLAERVLANTDDLAAHLALGRFYLAGAKFDEAERELTALLNKAPNRADIHNDLGVTLFGKGQLALALRHFDQAVQLDNRLGEALFNGALCHQKLMLLHAAQEDWKRYLELERNQRWTEEARHHREQIEALSKIDWNETGKQAQEKFILAYRQHDDERAQALVNEHANWIELLAANQIIPEYLEQRQQGNKPAAEENLRLAEYIGHSLATLKGDRAVADAVRFYKLMPRQTWNAHLAAYQQYKEGKSLSGKGDYTAATRELRNAAKVLAQLGDPFYSERTELLIGNNLYEQKQYLECLALLSRILPQMSKRDHKKHEILALSTLGYAYDFLGNHSESLNYLQHALSVEQTGNLLGERGANFLNFIGINQAYLGQHRAAIKTFGQALEVSLTSARSLLTEAVYQNLANSYMGLKDYWMAAQYQGEVLFRKEQVSAPNLYYLSNTLTNTGQVYIHLGDDDKARFYLERALQVNQSIKDIGERTDADVFTLSRLGRLYRSSGDLAEAAKIFDRCRAQLGQKQEYRLEVYADSARTRLALGQYPSAREELDQAIQLYEENRAWLAQESERNFFFTQGQDLYDDMVLLLYDHLNQPEAALDYSERSKARSFLDLVSTEARLVTEGEKSEVRLLGDAQPRHFTEMAATLPGDISLLHYAVTGDKIIVWLINRGRPLQTAEVSIGAEALQQKVQQFLTAIKQRLPLPQVRAQAQQLYTDLIEPVAPFLEPGKTLCIIPDGALHYLPFAALICPATGHYLVQDYGLTTCPSASIFLYCLELHRRKPRARSKLLAIGNPSADSQLKLSALPFAEQEVDQVAHYYPVVTKLLRQEAHEDHVLQAMPRFDVIHFATHCLIRDKEPMFSALALAPESPTPSQIQTLTMADPRRRDGLLQVFELYGLQLPQTSLVVLSACESGLGGFLEGEGIVGLTRPFIRAGVPTLVVSLWPIPDSKATVDVMAQFHRRWQAGYQPADALREAQINLLSHDQSYQHPYYWAPFLVVGSYQ